MNGREFISRVRKLGRKNGVDTTVDAQRGKGSHVTLCYGARFTIVPDRKKELRPGLFHAMCQQLGITPEEL